MKKTISLVGFGNIGVNIASQLVGMQFSCIVKVYDKTPDRTMGRILDAQQAAYVVSDGKPLTTFVFCQNLSDALTETDVIIVTAGVPRKPEMTRADVTSVNSVVIEEIATQFATLYSNQSEDFKTPFVVMVTNPLDVMSLLFYKKSLIKPQMVVGMSGVLDSARYNLELIKLGFEKHNATKGSVFGLHNDDMIFYHQNESLDGNDNEELSLIKKEAQQNTVQIGSRINQLSGNSAFIAPASAAIRIAQSYLHDLKRTIICSSYSNGLFGIDDAFFGVPVVIGSSGVEQVAAPVLSSELIDKLKASIG